MGVSGGLTSKGVVKWCVESVWVTLCVQSPPNGEIAPRRTTLQPSGVFSPTGDLLHFFLDFPPSTQASQCTFTSPPGSKGLERSPLSVSFARLFARALPPLVTSSLYRDLGKQPFSPFRCFWKQVKVLNSIHRIHLSSPTDFQSCVCMCMHRIGPPTGRMWSCMIGSRACSSLRSLPLC